MRTNTTVQSLDLRLSYFGGQPLREEERRGSGMLMRQLKTNLISPSPVIDADAQSKEERQC